MRSGECPHLIQKTMKLYLIRHGETQWNKQRKVQGHADIPLNEHGRYLAVETAKGLSDIKFDLAYTSPLVRAKETAEIILAGRGVPLHEDIRIQEIGFGVAEGMNCSRENQSKESRAFQKFFDDTVNYEVPEGGESIWQLTERVQEFFEELYKKDGWEEKTILISTHGAAVTAMLNLMRGETDYGGFWKNGVPANCAVTEVDVINGKARIVEESKVYY